MVSEREAGERIAAALELARSARDARSRADDAYREAVAAAVAAGASYADLARTLGLSRQAVRQLVNRSQ